MGMDPGPPSTPAERFSTLLRWLGLAIDARRLFGLGPPLISLVIVRFGRLNQLFDRIASGRFVPRRRAATVPPRLPRYGPPAPPPLRLPRKFGWLLPLVPDAVGYRSQLEYLLGDPETTALMQAAPAPMARALRPLCRMLGLRPPKIIAPAERPRRPRKPRAPRPPLLPPEPPPIPGLPFWMQGRRDPWTLTRMCGSRRRR